MMCMIAGIWSGLTSYHNKKYMLRAVHEGIVCSLLTHVKRLMENREAPETIRLSSGAANSQVWVRCFPDTNRHVIEDKELGAQGAAIEALEGVWEKI